MHVEDIFILGRSIRTRSIFNAIIIVATLFLPWWIPALLVIAGLVVFKSYIESVVWAMYVEGVYRYNEQFPVVLVLTILLFVFASFVRSRLVYVRNERYTL
jgi:hypothetical protein